jgi:hypothetical protein
MSRDDHEPVEIAGTVEHETERAFKFNDGDRIVWLPKSQCEWDEIGTMTVPEWLALKTGLI